MNDINVCNRLCCIMKLVLPCLVVCDLSFHVALIVASLRLQDGR